MVHGRFYMYIHSKDRRKQKWVKKPMFSPLMTRCTAGRFLQKTGSFPSCLSAQTFPVHYGLSVPWPPLSGVPALITVPGGCCCLHSCPAPCCSCQRCAHLAAGSPGTVRTVPSGGTGAAEQKPHAAVNFTTPVFNKVWTLSRVWKSVVND